MQADSDATFHHGPGRSYGPAEERLRGPEPVSTKLDRLMPHLGLPPVSAITALLRSWPDIAGEGAARNSRPRIAGDALVITVSDTAWASEMGWISQQILATVNERCGLELQTVRISVSLHPGPA